MRLRVQAGEPWDDVVAYAVAHGLAGIEALSGIPGSSGAAPIQNIGAYGQELATRLVSVEFLDHDSGELERLPAAELEFGYRTSVFKQGRLGLVVSIDLELTGTAESAQRPRRLPATGRRPRRRARRPGADRAIARGGAGAARRQGDADLGGRSRLGQRRILLHQSDRERELRPVAARRRARGGRWSEERAPLFLPLESSTAPDSPSIFLPPHPRPGSSSAPPG